MSNYLEVYAFYSPKVMSPNYKLINVNLNHGMGGDYIYLCYQLGENIAAVFSHSFGAAWQPWSVCGSWGQS